MRSRFLIGLALDYAAAQIDPACDGLNWEMIDGVMCGSYIDGSSRRTAVYLAMKLHGPYGSIRSRARHPFASLYSPQCDWRQSGQLMDRFDLDLAHSDDPDEPYVAIAKSGIRANGLTRTIAIVRCVVASVHGDEVDIPDELVTGACSL